MEESGESKYSLFKNKDMSEGTWAMYNLKKTNNT
jgi:hypothetical protein